MVDRRGRLLALRTGNPADDPALAHSGGKAIVGDRVLFATDEGLRQLIVDEVGGRLVDGPGFPDTEPFVTAASQLTPAPGGAIYAADGRRVIHLTLLSKETS